MRGSHLVLDEEGFFLQVKYSSICSTWTPFHILTILSQFLSLLQSEGQALYGKVSFGC